MKLGINSLFILPFEFEEGLKFARDLGAEMIEIGTLGEPSRKYCDPEKLLADKGHLDRWLDVLKEHGLEISTITAHGSPLSPDKEAEEAWLLKIRTSLLYRRGNRRPFGNGVVSVCNLQQHKVVVQLPCQHRTNGNAGFSKTSWDAD